MEQPAEERQEEQTTTPSWQGIKQKRFPKSAPADAITIARLHAYLEEQMRKGYALYPVMWSAGGVFGYVRSLESDCEDAGQYHRGVTVRDR